MPIKPEDRQPDFETYLHRIGRSGRFGRKGAAFNLICDDEENDVMDQIEIYFEKQIPDVTFNNEEQFVDVLKRAGLTEG